jgi:predicted nuclease with TOPRIM domain
MVVSISALKAWRDELRARLREVDERERKLRAALEEGRIADEGLREVAWERVHALERERWMLEDKLDEVEESLESLDEKEVK